MSTNFLKWVEIAEKLGYEGDELRTFVKEQQDVERNERKVVRQMEAEERDKDREAEESDRKRKYDLEKLSLEQNSISHSLDGSQSLSGVKPPRQYRRIHWTF